MTEIDFYFHVEDKLRTTCALSAKASQRGLRVLAYCADSESGQKLSRMMWTTPATGFLPHCSSTDKLASVTPIIISSDINEPPHDQLLINLRDEQPSFFGRFQRLIEVVSLDEDDRQRARERFKFYRDRGYQIRSHDMSREAQ